MLAPTDLAGQKACRRAATYSASDNQAIPDYWDPSAVVYAFWDDLVVDASAGVYTAVQGSAPNRQLVIEWRNVAFADAPAKRVRAEAVLYENGRILMQYADIAADSEEQGGSATVGLEDEDSYTAIGSHLVCDGKMTR
jgi:hypothetical protein